MIDDEACMKIDNDYISAMMQNMKAAAVRGEESAGAKAQAASSAGGDRVVFSITRDVEHYKKMLNELPDIRNKKIDELKPVVAAGEYQVHPALVARKMLDSSW